MAEVRRPLVGLTALALFAFAANSLLCRAALSARAIDPVTFTAVRLLSGALVLGAVAGARGPATPGRRAWASAAALFAYAFAFSLSYTRLGAAVGALALFGAVQITMIGGGLAAGERPRVREWLGVLLSLAGLLGLTLPGLRAPDPLGVALMLGAGAAWGLYSLMGRGAIDPLVANAASFARSVPLALLAVAIASGVTVPRATPTGLALAVASGGLASGLGYAVWYAALRRLTATQAAVVQLAVPPLAAAGAVVWLHEAVSLRLAVSGAAILGGIALALAARAPGPAPPARNRVE